MPVPVLTIAPVLALEVAVQDDQPVPPEATPPTIGTSVMLSVRKRINLPCKCSLHCFAKSRNAIAMVLLSRQLLELIDCGSVHKLACS